MVRKKGLVGSDDFYFSATERTLLLMVICLKSHSVDVLADLNVF